MGQLIAIVGIIYLFKRIGLIVNVIIHAKNGTKINIEANISNETSICR